ncbi:hypothetical protein RO04_06155 [Aggregatibacter actinomycetemcomitans]|nr:hypothetical protein RO04_08380 [Aggregatibacter actinomycetemcomitans]OZV17405.1 hypothetical protein RO04_06155 [Aggregatibacter actinomycetemcomitans]
MLSYRCCSVLNLSRCVSIKALWAFTRCLKSTPKRVGIYAILLIALTPGSSSSSCSSAFNTFSTSASPLAVKCSGLRQSAKASLYTLDSLIGAGSTVGKLKPRNSSLPSDILSHDAFSACLYLCNAWASRIRAVEMAYSYFASILSRCAVR